ncbi:DNA phosphorothioation-associated putative methyltransferase [Noviherbaspirillum soli]|uniref:DNA phosphorothioation-associated putative methyltransferase n=1 Tax=Noviherbaspirillum soli TaxID=1064518 RepID=UPI00188C7A67|nr:DNA phosphorothioation-associated putative methyltransferase [Noviherbaspirillum soli]
MTKEQISNLGFGKFVGGNLYVHTSCLERLPTKWQDAVASAASLAGVSPDLDFNVVKLGNEVDELSLLAYRDFFDDPFPALAHSWRVSLGRNTVLHRTYEESGNPPILHRKELLLALSHPRRTEYQLITDTAETLGLFNKTNRIGFREHWHTLIHERGFTLQNGQFVPIGNTALALARHTLLDVGDRIDIRRHLTALSRSNFSTPIQALLRHGLITAQTTVFDYGCGKGDDLRNLRANGIDASGWDPHYACEMLKQKAQVVNLGFVINVIEDIDERVAALQGAYALTKGVLAVAAMLTSQMLPEGRPYRDGYLSSRNTFQKYFSQSQLRDFIEDTLGESAIAVMPGLFFVFRDKELEQRFLAARYSQRTRVKTVRACSYSRPRIPSYGLETNPSKATQVSRIDVERTAELFEACQTDFSRLWLQTLELGRPPQNHEVDKDLRDPLEQSIGTWSKVIRIILDRFSPAELDLARSRRISDLVVFGARQQFGKRPAYRQLEPALKMDIRYFFGGFNAWQAQARSVLFNIKDLSQIAAACSEAFEKGYGWLEAGKSLQLHLTLLERLPTILRVYVACATILYGDLAEFDLIKIHISSGKVSLLKFENFDASPLPRLLQRVKVNLRSQEFDVFEYGENYQSPLLYNKSRFINEEFPNFSQQVALEEAIDQLGIFNFSAYGPTESEFYRALTQIRQEIIGFELRRSSSIPNLDEPCGKRFTYRDFIECGETQVRTKLANLPQEADTYTALYDLAKHVIDPVVDYFGMIQLTYGFCSCELARRIKGRIAPVLDQHAGHERKKSGKFICERLGAACDFLIEDEDMEEVAIWIFENTNFDRIYFYGKNRPIHVSYSQTPARKFVHMNLSASGKLVPRLIRK